MKRFALLSILMILPFLAQAQTVNNSGILTPANAWPACENPNSGWAGSLICSSLIYTVGIEPDMISVKAINQGTKMFEYSVSGIGRDGMLKTFTGSFQRDDDITGYSHFIVFAGLLTNVSVVLVEH